MDTISDTAEKEFLAHALDEYPREACGLIIDNGATYVPFKNEHANPKLNFRMSDERYLEYLRAGRITALMHSHTWHVPVKNNYPSCMDMQAQEQMCLPWGIVHISQHRDIDGPFYFGDQVPIAPFVGRPFRPNVHDCYTLLRDIYRVEKNVTLPLFAREGRWWATAGDNFLRNNFQKAGFEQIDRRQLGYNDVIMDIVNPPKENKTINHIMIMRDKGQILHHLNERLSRHDPAQIWVKDSSICLRYKGAA